MIFLLTFIIKIVLNIIYFIYSHISESRHFRSLRTEQFSCHVVWSEFVMLLHGGEVESQIEETTVLVEGVENRSQ